MDPSEVSFLSSNTISTRRVLVLEERKDYKDRMHVMI